MIIFYCVLNDIKKYIQNSLAQSLAQHNQARSWLRDYRGAAQCCGWEALALTVTNYSGLLPSVPSSVCGWFIVTVTCTQYSINGLHYKSKVI